MSELTTLDYIIFFASLIAVMGFGLWAGRKEETSLDFFLAGKETRWWGVAGSVFGSNVSANHMVGMMGLGFSVGFAQSQFEITAIAGLLLLCYGFLPVYRKINIYTLSEYLTKRYGDTSRILYALIMLTIMVGIQMVPGFYIGSRTINILIQGGEQEISQSAYVIGIIVMALVTGTYTIFGGLKAVIMTDFIQSLLLLFGGLTVAFVVFAQPEIGGWGGMMTMDSAESGEGMMSLYRPSDHPKMPWTGMFTGLMFLHFYYWGANQFIVQRALAARSDKEARTGILAAGFFKLLIPFFSIGTGVAAFYLFRAKNMDVAQDAVFPTLLTQFISPIGFGLVGLIAAGVIGAILSSVDSMLNSSATIVTFDFYKRFVKPDASEQELVRLGRILIGIFIIIAAAITIFLMDPNSKGSFFLDVAKYQMKLVAGVFVAFFVGMLWKRATALGGTLAIIVGVFMSFNLDTWYNNAADGKTITQTSSTTFQIDPEKPVTFDYEAGAAVQFYKSIPHSNELSDSDKTFYIGLDSAKTSLTLHRTQQSAESGERPINFEFQENSTATVFNAGMSWWVTKFNTQLNFFHTTAVSVFISIIVMIVASLATPHNEDKAQFTWTGLGGFKPEQLRFAFLQLGTTIVAYVVLALSMLKWGMSPTISGIIALLWTWAMFAYHPFKEYKKADKNVFACLIKDDRFYGGLLGGLAVFLMFYFV